MDIFLLQSLVTEMVPVLVGHRPGRIWQVGTTDLLIDLNLRDGRWLRISTDPLRLGLYLAIPARRSARSATSAPRTDTPFVALCQKYLEGTRLTALEPLGYDRVVRLNFTDDDGAHRQLVVLLTGRTANVMLLNGRQILAELREREDTPEEYTDPLPPGDRIDPFACPPERLAGLIAREGDPGEAVRRHMLGFTPLLAREFTARCAESDSPALAWEGLLKDLVTPTPTIYANPPLSKLMAEPGGDELTLLLSSIPLRHLPARFQSHPPTLLDAAAQYFNFLEERRQFLAVRQRLASLFSTRIKRLGSLLANLDRETEKYTEVERWQRYGELLLTNLHEAVKTGEETRHETWLVVDYFDPEQNLIEIATAECGTAQETAKHYFRLARKGRHSRESIATRRPPVLAEIASLREDQERLSALTSLPALWPLAEKYGLKDEPAPVARATQGSRSKPEVIPGTRRYRSSDGYEILVGRTDRDNDHLTLRVARSFDLWFHAADYPGSHVILRNPKRQPVPARSIQEAGQLAAKFSQARELPKAAVNYCEKKFVTKPKGFAPGQVRLASFRTIMVEPAEAGERI
jgi:predicted ribosome quality control (RQC) complex YloA/Tae2 family protein